jgi:hypothetical protein
MLAAHSPSELSDAEATTAGWISHDFRNAVLPRLIAIASAFSGSGQRG